VGDHDTGDAPPEGLVWHYTDAQGLMSILRSDTLWATSAQFLNDAGEVAIAVELLRREVLERAAAGEDGPYRDVAALLDRGGRDHSISPASFFVLSAATGWDLLAMWRNYGGLGESYALGIDPAAPLAVLAESRDTGSTTVRQRPWTPVKYTPEDQSALVDAVFDDLPEEVARAESLAKAGAGRDEVLAEVAGLLDDLEQALLLIKHAGFVDERETRHSTVLYRSSLGEPAPSGLVRYRATPYGIAPYLWLTGGDDGSAVRTEAAPLPVRAVAVSPSPNGPAAVASLRDLLADCGYGDVGVWRSGIPFRS
jgi:hypothetical protein